MTAKGKSRHSTDVHAFARTARTHRGYDQGSRRAGEASSDLQPPYRPGRYRSDRRVVAVCNVGFWQRVQRQSRVRSLPWLGTTAIQQRRQDEYRRFEQEDRQLPIAIDTDPGRSCLRLQTQRAKELERQMAEGEHRTQRRERAAIALANKNVRTAWAMVTQGTEYQRRVQLEMAA